MDGTTGLATMTPGSVTAEAAAGSGAAVPPQAAMPADPATARGVVQRLEGLLQNLVTLKVVTVVGDLSVAGDVSSPSVSVRDPATALAASTEINLVDGHIVNAFSSGFAALDGGALQTFHQAQVDRSSGILLGNWAELLKLAGSLLATRR